MEFYEVLDQIVELIRQRGRATYRALKVQFQLDDDLLEALKEEIRYSQPMIIDDKGHGLIWTDVSKTQREPGSPSPPVSSLTSASHVPDAERRQLTVMFCDLVGSTELSGRLDPEDLRDVIRAYQSVSTEVIERYEGYVAQHLGDGLMVYFGWPQAHEDDAQRAVRAGLGIVDAMVPLNEQLGQDKDIRLALRIGIHTGPVVIGEIGSGASQEQLALGETPNVAARIQGLAESDTVVLSDATYRLVRGYFECDGLGDQTLRGVARAVGTYRVLRESGVQSRLEIAPILTPLVGREQEMGLILERWEQAQGESGQVVLLSGEAGVGKSRLVQVLQEQVVGVSHAHLEGRASPYYQNTPLYALVGAFEQAWNFQPEDTAETRLTKLEAALRQVDLPLEETVPPLAFVLSLPLPDNLYSALTISSQEQRQKTLETIVALVLKYACQQPVLFIIEDLHWIDPTTHDLLDLLIDQTPKAALFVFLTCRPVFRPAWSPRSYLTQITLNRLTHRQAEWVAVGVAGAKRLPDEVIDHIVTKTDGVPLFIEELGLDHRIGHSMRSSPQQLVSDRSITCLKSIS